MIFLNFLILAELGVGFPEARRDQRVPPPVIFNVFNGNHISVVRHGFRGMLGTKGK